MGGLVSLGHAVFFGIGGYAMGILASHAQTYAPIMEWPFVIEGTKSMPVIWVTAIVASARGWADSEGYRSRDAS